MTTTIEKTLIGLLLCGLVAAVALPYPKLAPRPVALGSGDSAADAEVRNENRTWPYAKCAKCRANEASWENVRYETNWSMSVLCQKCWDAAPPEERMDWCDQVLLGFMGSEPWPKSKRLKVIKAFLNQAALKAEQEPK